MRSHILRVTVDYLTLTARNCRESLIIYRYEFISTSAEHHQGLQGCALQLGYIRLYTRTKQRFAEGHFNL